MLNVRDCSLSNGFNNKMFVATDFIPRGSYTADPPPDGSGVKRSESAQDTAFLGVMRMGLADGPVTVWAQKKMKWYAPEDTVRFDRKYALRTGERSHQQVHFHSHPKKAGTKGEGPSEGDHLYVGERKDFGLVYSNATETARFYTGKSVSESLTYKPGEGLKKTNLDDGNSGNVFQPGWVD